MQENGLVESRVCKSASGAGIKRSRERALGNVRGKTGQIIWGLACHHKDFGFYFR